MMSPEADFLPDVQLQHQMPTCVFGLTQEQLWPVVEQLAGESVAHFSLTLQDQVQGFPGWAGQKLVPTITYETIGGRSGQSRLFVKKLSPGLSEELHYRYLHEQDFPVARLYGAVRGAQGEEILFLEYLERTFNAIDPAYASLRTLFLQQLACFHNLELTPTYRSQLPVENLTSHLTAERITATIQRIADYACQGRPQNKLMHLAKEAQRQLPELLNLAQEVAGQIEKMEIGLTNGEFGLGACASSGSTFTDWRLFDLHSIGLRPRFFDLVHLFGSPEQLTTVYGPSWRGQPRLGYYYLEQLSAGGGPSYTLSDLFDQCESLWLAYAFKLDWWIELAQTGAVIWTTDRKAGRRHCRRQLTLLFEALLTRCGSRA
ncbi:hypothetical protein [Tengunoibacter tsumagoiensis]|uniref:Aminoglycoside phosphotransferase domain-containing protein n=1 Tax=Tengunoibacter tsumagoiensis TaxID=2014871 RepID=A0A402A506_9CHLR|nr:hypothetical protein [Tengunoibacter tsumagoiensis]GCE14095.1 hypothetical protein KTT_39540 [Tengunoibacter tsumagoiensis]